MDTGWTIWICVWSQFGHCLVIFVGEGFAVGLVGYIMLECSPGLKRTTVLVTISVSPTRNQKVHRFKDGIVRSLPIIGLIGLIACQDSDKSISVTNRAPIAAITSHSDGDQVLESIPTLFIGNVSDPNEPTEDLLVTWYADLEELCPEAPPEVDATTRCEAVVGPNVEEIVPSPPRRRAL